MGGPFIWIVRLLLGRCGRWLCCTMGSGLACAASTGFAFCCMARATGLRSGRGTGSSGRMPRTLLLHLGELRLLLFTEGSLSNLVVLTHRSFNLGLNAHALLAELGDLVLTFQENARELLGFRFTQTKRFGIGCSPHFREGFRRGGIIGSSAHGFGRGWGCGKCERLCSGVRSGQKDERTDQKGHLVHGRNSFESTKVMGSDDSVPQLPLAPRTISSMASHMPGSICSNRLNWPAPLSHSPPSMVTTSPFT